MFRESPVFCYLLIVLFSRKFYAMFAPGDLELIDFSQSKRKAIIQEPDKFRKNIHIE